MEQIENSELIKDYINGCNNTKKWVAELDNKLENILIQKLEKAVELRLTEFLAAISLHEAVLLQDCSFHKFLEPILNETREYWYNQLHKVLVTVLDNKHFTYQIRRLVNIIMRIILLEI